jgi:hypothetical protein
MKHLLIATTFMLFFSFCQSKEKTSKTLEKEPAFRLSEHYSKFKFHDLTEFKLGTYSDDNDSKAGNQYQKLDSALAFKIFQQEDSLSLYDAHFYYSTFSDPTLISILENSEANGWTIWLCKFDKNGKFMGKEMIANHLIDGGEYWRSYGKFIGNNTFIHTEIDAWNLPDEEGKIDSSVVKIRFEKDNTIKIDTLFKNQEIIKNKKE